MKRLRDLKAWKARTSTAVTEGTYVPPWDGTVSELIDAYLKAVGFGREANTVLSYRNALEPARERLGHKRAKAITRQIIEDELRDWMLTEGRRRGGKRGTGLGARSVILTIGRFAAAFELACRDRKLAHNPCQYVELPRQARTQRDTWSADDARKFLTAADCDRLAAAWRMTLYGARRGELLGLRWGDIDLDAGTLRIGRARVLVGGQVIEKAPKSDNGYRTLPLDDALVGALRELRKRQREERLAAGPAYTDAGYVVADETGVPVHPEWFTDEFHRVAARAGVPRIRLHDSRHTTNSLMAAAGVPDHIRAAWCGHTVVVNVATYTHARPEDLALARDALSKIYNSAV
jgi:integrase